MGCICVFLHPVPVPVCCVECQEDARVGERVSAGQREREQRDADLRVLLIQALPWNNYEKGIWLLCGGRNNTSTACKLNPKATWSRGCHLMSHEGGSEGEGMLGNGESVDM